VVDGEPGDRSEQDVTSPAGGASQSKPDTAAILPVIEHCPVPQPELYEEY
jgi:hypothetical protein